MTLPEMVTHTSWDAPTPINGAAAGLLTRRSHRGFTLFEMLTAIAIAGIMTALALPEVGRIVAHSRVNQATSVVAADLELAFSLAARQRRPVRITIDDATRSYTFTDRATAAVLARRVYDMNSEYKLSALSGSVASVDVFPTGVASGPDTITVRVGNYSRRVAMSRTGQVRVLDP